MYINILGPYNGIVKFTSVDVAQHVFIVSAQVVTCRTIDNAPLNQFNYWGHTENKCRMKNVVK